MLTLVTYSEYIEGFHVITSLDFPKIFFLKDCTVPKLLDLVCEHSLHTIFPVVLIVFHGRITHQCFKFNFFRYILISPANPSRASRYVSEKLSIFRTDQASCFTLFVGECV